MGGLKGPLGFVGGEGPRGVVLHGRLFERRQVRVALARRLRVLERAETLAGAASGLSWCVLS